MGEKRIWTGMGRFVPGLGKELAALRQHSTVKNCWVGVMGDTAVIAYEGTFRPDGSCEDVRCLTLFENAEAMLPADEPTTVSMADPNKSKPKNFSVFRSAAEEADMKNDEQSWDNEGGHMSCTSGRIVSVPGDKPFKVVMSRETGGDSDHLFATMRAAEAFIRRNTPRPPERARTYDRKS